MLSSLTISLLIIAISYPITIASSIILYSLHSSNSIITYQTQSLGAAVSQYSWWIIGWLSIGVIYFQLFIYSSNEIKAKNTTISNNNDQKHIPFKHEKIIICIAITILYFHNIINSENNSLCQQFKNGSTQLSNITMDHPKYWPGWRYYQSDSYYGQTKYRLQQSRKHQMSKQQYTTMLVSLKNIHEGINSIRNWLINHRLFYSMLSLGHKSAGFLILVCCWIIGICSTTCSLKYTKRVKYCSLLYFVLIWIVIIPFIIISQIIQSLIMLNNHQICQSKLNSSNLNIIINQDSISFINNLQFNAIEDPYSIYSNICKTMQLYYQSTIQLDKYLVQNALGATWILFMLAAIFNIVNLALPMVLNSRKKINLQQKTESDEKLQNMIKIDCKKIKHNNGYQYVQQQQV